MPLPEGSYLRILHEIGFDDDEMISSDARRSREALIDGAFCPVLVLLPYFSNNAGRAECSDLKQPKGHLCPTHEPRYW
jgi:hypothetical protein